MQRNEIGLYALDTAATYQWVRCSGTWRIPMYNENEQAFRVPLDDFYAVVLEKDGCIDTSQCVLVLLTGVEDVTADAISVYPNPTANNVTVKLNHASKRRDVLVYNVANQLVGHALLNAQNEVTVQLPEAPGMYIIRVVTDGSSHTIKVLKQND